MVSLTKEAGNRKHYKDACRGSSSSSTTWDLESAMIFRKSRIRRSEGNLNAGNDPQAVGVVGGEHVAGATVDDDAAELTGTVIGPPTQMEVPLPAVVPAVPENVAGAAGPGEVTREFMLGTPTSGDSARSRLRRSERLHAMHDIANALRDRGSPDTIFTTGPNAGGAGGNSTAPRQATRLGGRTSGAKSLSISSSIKGPVSGPSFDALHKRPHQSPSPPGMRRQLGSSKCNVASTSRVQLPLKRNGRGRRSPRKLQRAPRVYISTLRLSSQLQSKVRRVHMFYYYQL